MNWILGTAWLAALIAFSLWMTAGVADGAPKILAFSFVFGAAWAATSALAGGKES